MPRSVKKASDFVLNAYFISIPALCSKPREWRLTPMKAPTRPRPASKSDCADTNAGARITRRCAAVEELSNCDKNGSKCPASAIDAVRDRPYGPPPSTPLAIRSWHILIIGHVHDAHRSRRAGRNCSGTQGQQQETGDPGARRARGQAHGSERAY